MKKTSIMGIIWRKILQVTQKAIIDLSKLLAMQTVVMLGISMIENLLSDIAIFLVEQFLLIITSNSQ